jgi:hypothetical protein
VAKAVIHFGQLVNHLVFKSRDFENRTGLKAGLLEKYSAPLAIFCRGEVSSPNPLSPGGGFDTRVPPKSKVE